MGVFLKVDVDDASQGIACISSWLQYNLVLFFFQAEKSAFNERLKAERVFNQLPGEEGCWAHAPEASAKCLFREGGTETILGVWLWGMHIWNELSPVCFFPTVRVVCDFFFVFFVVFSLEMFQES